MKDIYMYVLFSFFFFFNDTATTEIYSLSLHDALPICRRYGTLWAYYQRAQVRFAAGNGRSEEHTSELQSQFHLVCRLLLEKKKHEDISHNGHQKRVRCMPRRHRKDATGVVFALHRGHDTALFLLRRRHPPNSTLFPYTTLFR